MSGDLVGLYLDMDQKTLTYYINGKMSPGGVAFRNIPEEKFHFYFSGANGDDYEVTFIFPILIFCLFFISF